MHLVHLDRTLVTDSNVQPAMGDLRLKQRRQTRFDRRRRIRMPIDDMVEKVRHRLAISRYICRRVGLIARISASRQP